MSSPRLRPLFGLALSLSRCSVILSINFVLALQGGNDSNWGPSPCVQIAASLLALLFPSASYTHGRQEKHYLCPSLYVWQGRQEFSPFYRRENSDGPEFRGCLQRRCKKEAPKEHQLTKQLAFIKAGLNITFSTSSRRLGLFQLFRQACCRHHPQILLPTLYIELSLGKKLEYIFLGMKHKNSGLCIPPHLVSLSFKQSHCIGTHFSRSLT
jgi:hypothetical protein